MKSRVSPTGKVGVTPFVFMENKVIQEEISEEEFLLRQWKDREKTILICNARSHVVESQITEAYGMVENIRFDFLGDTAFRDKIVQAKKSLESALSDFLLSGEYHRMKLKEHRSRTPEEYSKYLVELGKTPQQSEAS